MPRCPECNELIEELRHYSVEEGATDLRLVDGKPEEKEALPMEHTRDDFECPDCGDTLFVSMEDAVEFLAKESDIPPAPQHEDDGFDNPPNCSATTQ